ncbi:DUF2971 domain-containing protein [Mesorhizobium sp. M0027]|uniref:DUF2971 domain-containing protein n=1 Tax=Mesorhizobium sp. M0027 TaxID=2956848 RepID=UPI00333BE44C
MQVMSQEDFQGLAVFDPEGAKKRLDLMLGNGRLIHYTTADVALKIFRSSEVWMRNVRCMNDFSEVEHGVSMMHRFFMPPDDDHPDVGRAAFIDALNSLFPEVFENTIGNMNAWLHTIINESYITCLSEHSKSEGDNGRLSMWRAYGSGTVGVGILINPLPLYSVTSALGAYSSPVSYYDQEQYFSYLRNVTENIIKEADFLKKLGEERVSGYFFNLMLMSALCCKHPGFLEEKEWRIIHIPKMWKEGVLKRSTEVVGGVPQSVYKIPLKDIDGEIEGIMLEKLLDRIIIGPTAYPLTVSEALIAELKTLDVPDAESKVVASRIPLRNGF